LTKKKLKEITDKYFEENRQVSIADMCVYIGISLEEWYEITKNPRLHITAKRIETHIQALIEADPNRSATITSLLLKQLDEPETDNRAEFVLKFENEA